MANSILSSIFSKSVTRFVNEGTGLPVWTEAKSVDIEIISDSENSDTPLSTQQVSDSGVNQKLLASDVSTGKILMPNHLRITLMTNNLSLVENILALYQDTSVTISITSKSIISKSMAIMTVEIDHDPEVLSAVKIVITFEQSRTSRVVPFDPSQAADQNSFGLSVQSPQTVGSNLGALQQRVGGLVETTGNAVTSLYNRVINNIGLG